MMQSGLSRLHHDHTLFAKVGVIQWHLFQSETCFRSCFPCWLTGTTLRRADYLHVTLHALIVIHAAALPHLLRRRTTSLLSSLAEIVKPKVGVSPLPYCYTFFEVAQIDPTLAFSQLFKSINQLRHHAAFRDVRGVCRWHR